jgi:hypothetical protein
LINEGWHNDKLAYQGFESAGQFAAYVAQCESLRLKPWESPPATTCGSIPDPNLYGSRPAEITLRDRLVNSGLSCYEPDPSTALETVSDKRHKSRNT